jgi:Ca2+-binding RTX toxin-like protein
MTNVSGMSTLWLDVNDGTADGDEHIVLKNFSGSTINLTGLASATDSNPESLTIDGTSQAALTVNVRSYATGTGEATVFTGVESVTISGTSVINSAKVTNTLGTVTAASATGIGLSTSGSLATDPNTGALTVDSITAANAQTVRLNAGNYDTLKVTQDVSAANGLVQTLDIDVGTASTLNIDGGDIILTGSSLQTATIDVLANGTLTEASGSTNVNLQATQIASLTANLGANSTTRLDIESGVTSGTVTMSSGSVFFADDIGKAGRDSSITFTGTGDVDKTAAGVTNITLLGATASLNFGGLTDSDGVSIISNASVRGTVTGTAFADEISGGAGNDSFSGGSGDDRLGYIGRQEKIDIGYSADGAVVVTINGVDVTFNAATNDSDTADAAVTAINAAVSTFVTAAKDGSNDVVLTYSQFFGTPGAEKTDTKANVDGWTVTTIGDNAGADTLRGGEGADIILGGSGNDTIILTETTNATDTVFFATTAALNGSDTITGFITTSDKLDIGGLTTATATTAVTGALTTTAGLVYFLAGQAAGAADTAAAVATAVTAGATWTNANVTAFIVVVDTNSTAVYAWTDAATAGVQEAELTLLGTIDAVMVTGDIIFGG